MPRTDLRALAVPLALIVAIGLALCGCSRAGASTSATRSLTPGACSAPTLGVAVSQPGSVPTTRAPLAMPVTTLPPGVTYGQVQVVVESGSYGADSTIFAWAGNGLSQCIYANDHQSACSIVVLERQVNGGWQPQANCQRVSPVRTVALPPMQAAFIRLAPTTTGGQQGVWQGGIYRVAFGYRLDPNGTGQPSEVDSTSFTIS